MVIRDVSGGLPALVVGLTPSVCTVQPPPPTLSGLTWKGWPDNKGTS